MSPAAAAAAARTIAVVAAAVLLLLIDGLMAAAMALYRPEWQQALALALPVLILAALLFRRWWAFVLLHLPFQIVVLHGLATAGGDHAGDAGRGLVLPTIQVLLLALVVRFGDVLPRLRRR